jgi:uncharacterized protein YbaP (TraB family)
MRFSDRLRHLIIRFVIGMLWVGFCHGSAAAPALWVVRSPSATVYLFGTVHNLPPNLNWHSPVVDRALSTSQQIWTEAQSGSLPHLNQLIARYGILRRGDLRNLLPRQYRTRYDVQVSNAGLRTDDIGQVRPWLAQMLLSGETLHRVPHGFAVESELLSYARRRHLQVHTFESADSQFAVLGDMPLEAQVRALEMEIDGYPSANGEMNALVQSWLDGQDELLDQLTNQRIAVSDERYFDDIIVRRDEEFATAIVALLQNTGTSFVVLGAAHLCGSTGVQALLQNQGYTAERISG